MLENLSLEEKIEVLEGRYNDAIRYAFQCEEFGSFSKADGLFEKAELIRKDINTLKESVK